MSAATQPQILDLAADAWQMRARIATEQDGAVVPSMPILFFGDLARYEASRLRVITVGLNPSDEEFPREDPWRRFPGGAQLNADDLDRTSLTRYVDELSRYFEVAPYRRWFDRSFEPLLRGLNVSYYPHAANVALHTDIASPVPTTPTWSELSPARRALHHGGAALWRRLADLLAPDVIVVSVAREHLAAISTSPFSEWSEQTHARRPRTTLRRLNDTNAGGRGRQVGGRCVRSLHERAVRKCQLPQAGMDRRSDRLLPRHAGAGGGVVREGLQTEGDVRFVQFPHPGKEHVVGPSGIRPWPRADELHRRTFLQSPAGYRLEGDGPDEHGDVMFWGEWEGEARLITELDPVPEGPRFLCAPNPRGEPPITTDGTPPQNTDPFVWGEMMAYIGCRQPRNRKLRELGRGSLILFGSNLNDRFVLDTAFVVDGWAAHDCDTFPEKLDGIASEAHMRAGVAPFHGWGMKKTLRYYAGATPRDPVGGMYSFVPCLAANGRQSGFARPSIQIDGLIDPHLRMQARSSRPFSTDSIAEVWGAVVDQVTGQGLALATRLELLT